MLYARIPERQRVAGGPTVGRAGLDIAAIHTIAAEAGLAAAPSWCAGGRWFSHINTTVT